jgi:hypothetical protein
LGPVVEQRQLPVVDGNDPQYPGGGHAALGENHLYPEKHFRVHLKAAVAGRLHDAEKARLLHRGDGSLWQLAQPGSFESALAQCGHQVPGGLIELFGAGNLGCVHSQSSVS